MAAPHLLRIDERVRAVEDAFVAHWRHFGAWRGAELHERDGVLWFESPIRALPYNAVIRTRVPVGEDADAAVGAVTARFRERDVPFMWVVLPHDEPDDLDQRLPPHGLDLVETATGMDLDLAGWTAPAPAVPAQVLAVTDDDGLQEYEELIRTYWSVPEDARHLLRTLNRHWTGERAPGIRLVAHLDGRAVGKLFLNTSELPERVAVYGVAVRPQARGRGVARALMHEALTRAVTAGARRCVLHSSEMALPMYERMGFAPLCELRVYATGPLFGTHHH